PYGGTFLIFSDYMRNAIRLAALMKAKAMFVMTHDSIGLGEDGPTHQPIEHLASLRAIPGLHVFRPADVVETMEAYQAALGAEGPSLFAFSRQGVPQVRTVAVDENLTARGAYVIVDPRAPRDVTLLATGTEVSIAIEAASALANAGISAAVVSMPCWSLFEAQDIEYKKAVLGDAPRLAIEAASAFGWTRYVASEDHMIGVNAFGESASANHLYAHFGLTADNVLKRAKALIEESKTASAA
ncbi:MAG: transketolase C-terminal domain-containing protein, partial [Pseudomonadota bacterium]